MKPPPRILIIAGPNGAGKTTFAREFLPLEAQCPVFINADLIAAQGGHHIPDEVVRRRFDAGLIQFEKTYRTIVNAWYLYDNQHRQPILLDQGAHP